MSDALPTLNEIQAAFGACKFELAWQLARTRIETDPDDAAALFLAARAGQRCGKLEDAYADLLTAMALEDNPSFLELQREFDCEFYGQQAQYLGESQRYAEADALFAKAEGISQNVPELFSAIGHVEMARGRLERAIENFQRSASTDRPCRIGHSNLLLALTHSETAPESIFQSHLAWARRYAPADIVAVPIRDSDPNRTLRIGLVSPDFRAHPVAHFLLPVLQHHDRSQIHFTCYDDRPAPPGDVMAPLLRASADQWVSISLFSPRELVQRVADDRIDILFDLTVHSDRNRLPLFAHRLAPIQISWLGYIGTTGLSTMDYRITDAVVEPPGESEHFSTEKLLRLPDIFWCYAPSPETPAETETPRPDTGRPMRIGVATRLAKISSKSLDFWCALLHQLPEAHFVLGDQPMANESVRTEWMEKFMNRGIDAARIHLVPGQKMPQYLAFQGSLDLAVDTFPFNGGTTVCHQLYMGTPVIALRGRAGTGRVTASILTAIGHSEMIAENEQQWLRLNVELARDVDRRAHLRQTLRREMMASPLGDGARFTRNFEAAMRDIWRERCEAASNV